MQCYHCHLLLLPVPSAFDLFPHFRLEQHLFILLQKCKPNMFELVRLPFRDQNQATKFAVLLTIEVSSGEAIFT